MNTNAKLDVRMPNKVIFVETFDDLDIVGMKNTLYIVRDENDQMYEFTNSEYRALTTKGDLPPDLEKDIKELKKHPIKNVATETVHGIRFKNGSLYVTDEAGKEHEIEAGGGGDGHGYKQVTKLGVEAPKDVEIKIKRTTTFLQPPIDVLSFVAGEVDIEVGADFNNESADDFEPNDAFIFTDDGFTLVDNTDLQGDVTAEWEEDNVTSFKIDTDKDLKSMEVVYK